MSNRSFTFCPHEHLRRPSDFRRVYDRRRSVSDEWLIVYGCENGLSHLRLGLSVSRKVGSAVARNRLRRLYREAFRLTRHEMPTGLDIVLVPRQSVTQARMSAPGQTEMSAPPGLEQLKQSLPKLVSQLKRKIEREAGRT